MLPMGEIVPSPSNPRKHFDDAYLAELAESIKSHGLIQPITVRPLPFENFLEFNKRRADGDDRHPQYEIVVGECRWRAAQAAGLTEIPGFWRELDDKQVLEIQVIENLQRRDVHPLEEAEGYQQLMQRHGYSADTIAAKIGKSRGYVYARLKLLALGQPAREAFFASNLDASTALLIARVPASLQAKALASVINGYDGVPLSYRAAKATLQRNFTVELHDATWPLDDATLCPVAGSCSACPKRAGNDLVMTADGIDAHVCTDIPCFDEKKTARRAQLIVSAEANGIQVFTGEAARELMPWGPRDIDRGTYVSIDMDVPGDPEDRTYRQILGDAAPVAALVESRDGDMLELAEPTALARALQQAGYQPDPQPETAADQASAEKAAARAQQQAEAAAREAAAEAEGERRKALADTLFARARTLYDEGYLNADHVLNLLAVASMRLDYSYNGEPDAPRLKRFGVTLPEETSDDDNGTAIMEATAAAMRQWSPGTALAYLLDGMTAEELQVNRWNYDPKRDRPFILEDLAAFLTAADPTQAAQAHGKGGANPAAPTKPKGKKTAAAKGKAKTAPAPTASANEPAAPVKPLGDWPFPVAAEAA
jgi:ParB/RepB/Spo0J family partition protein